MNTGMAFANMYWGCVDQQLESVAAKVLFELARCYHLPDGTLLWLPAYPDRKLPFIINTLFTFL
jgi:hypothetical protein